MITKTKTQLTDGKDAIRVAIDEQAPFYIRVRKTSTAPMLKGAAVDQTVHIQPYEVDKDGKELPTKFALPLIGTTFHEGKGNYADVLGRRVVQAVDLYVSVSQAHTAITSLPDDLPL